MTKTTSESPTVDSLNGLTVQRSDYASHPGATALHFGRFEYKYVISDSALPSFESAIAKFMELDPNCIGQSDESYNVTSIYFDTRNLACYHEKQDGLLNRRKFRIRTYEDTGTSRPFLEEKGRRNAYSYKKRILLPGHLVMASFEADWRRLSEYADKLDDPFEAFVAAGWKSALAPTARVSYRRRAYVGKGGYRFRVTLDGNITGAAARLIGAPAAVVRPALPGRTIVEIKFDQQVPLWFIRLIESAQLTRQSISKYCICAEALGLVEPDEPFTRTGGFSYLRW